MRLAIFDLDETLLKHDSDIYWWHFLADNKVVDKDAFEEKRLYFRNLYHQGTLDIYEYCSYTLSPFKEHPQELLLNLKQRFVREVAPQLIYADAYKVIEKHRQQGDYLLIITATNRFVAEPFAALLKVDDMIATEPEVINGRYTGDIIGTPSFREGKITRLKEWLQSHPELNLQGSYFYSDSTNDVPLLQMVDNPIVANPNAAMLAVAKEKNWPIVNFK